MVYDLIVVGVGPSGLLAARAAAENGLNVALLERRKDPARLSRACGQTLVSMNERLFGNICNYNARDKLICFSGDGFCARYDGPYRNIHGVFNHAPNGHVINLGIPQVQRDKGDGGRAALSFDKELLISQWLEDARTRHVDVFTGIPVERVTTGAEGVTVEGAGKKWEGSYLVAADGSNSSIARLAGFNETRDYYCNLYALAYEVTGLQPPEPDVVVRVADWINSTYSAMFIMPRFNDGEAIIALVTVDPRANLETALEYFTTSAFCSPWFRTMRRGRRWVATVNCFSPIDEPYRDRILITGDAAATQELENSGAMLTGWKAGQAMATAVLENRVGLDTQGIASYVTWWQSTYIHGPGITPEEYMKSFATPFIFDSPDDLNTFFGMITEPLPAVYNPYVSPTAAIMKKIMPVLVEKYPEIVEKMKKRSLPATKLFAEVASISKPVFNEE